MKHVPTKTHLPSPVTLPRSANGLNSSVFPEFNTTPRDITLVQTSLSDIEMKLYTL
jgi:hypothetical protein